MWFGSLFIWIAFGTLNDWYLRSSFIKARLRQIGGSKLLIIYFDAHITDVSNAWFETRVSLLIWIIGRFKILSRLLIHYLLNFGCIMSKWPHSIKMWLWFLLQFSSIMLLIPQTPLTNCLVQSFFLAIQIIPINRHIQVHTFYSESAVKFQI